MMQNPESSNRSFVKTRLPVGSERDLPGNVRGSFRHEVSEQIHVRMYTYTHPHTMHLYLSRYMEGWPTPPIPLLSQQGLMWDPRNAWAPLQLMLIEGLETLSKKSPDVAG